jgi:hypothetical protein
MNADLFFVRVQQHKYCHSEPGLARNLLFLPPQHTADSSHTLAALGARLRARRNDNVVGGAACSRALILLPAIPSNQHATANGRHCDRGSVLPCGGISLRDRCGDAGISRVHLDDAGCSATPRVGTSGALHVLAGRFVRSADQLGIVSPGPLGALGRHCGCAGRRRNVGANRVRSCGGFSLAVAMGRAADCGAGCDGLVFGAKASGEGICEVSCPHMGS